MQTQEWRWRCGASCINALYLTPRCAGSSASAVVAGAASRLRHAGVCSVSASRLPPGLDRLALALWKAGARCRRPAGLRLGRKSPPVGCRRDLAVGRACRCISERTRPVSWLGSKSFGTHLRTKGAQYFAGGHRRRVPPTASGLLIPAVLEPARHQETARSGWKSCRSTEHASRGSGRSHLPVPPPEAAWRNAHTVAEGTACWASRRACGT